MKRMQRQLMKEGFVVENIDYPSTRHKIEVLVTSYVKPKVEAFKKREFCRTLHFVTHSMGGILVRYYLKHFNLPELGRIVMISPPNKGSELVDKLSGFFIFRWVNGPAGRQLGTGAQSMPNSLGPARYDVAIIAGNRSLNPFYSYLIPGKDDGKVAIDRARLEGMKAFTIVPKSHTFIAGSRTVINLVTGYLKDGRF